jgi:colicin import membrane protein
MSWLITMGISMLFHFVLVLLLSLNPWPTLIKVRPTVYTVTLMPVSIPEPEIPPPTAPPVPKEEKIKPVEKIKPIQKPKKDDIVEKVKKKERDKESIDRLHNAIEEIRRKAALDEIHKRVSKREVTPTPSPSPSPVISPVPSPTAPSPTPFSVSAQQSKLNEYYSLIWAKIKASWTIPEHLLKERVDLETIIVIIIEVNGKVQKSWFEKKSGNALYDQMAMRAIIKAEPLPPIPKELNQESLEIGIRFTPD